MKISDLKIREIQADIPPVTGGTYRIVSRRALLCRITTDDGLVSEVCVGNQSTYPDAIKELLRGEMRSLILGADPLMTTAIWQRLFALATGSERAHAMRALSIVDICLWNLKGLATGQPIWRMIGGARRDVPVIAIGGYYETSAERSGLTEEIARLRRNGFAGMKIKVGALRLEEDTERVHAARKVGGDDFVLVVDSNMAWTTQDAVRFARMIRPSNPMWLEEPVRWQNMNRGLREVRQLTGVRTGAGQSEVSVFDCVDMLTREAVDVINVGAARAGGITGWTMLAGAAALSDVDMAQVAEPHISMHLMAGIANATYVECYGDPKRDPFWSTLYADRPELCHGYLRVPDLPGLGLTLDPDRVETFVIEPWS
jgi:L-alanine-DL-glutamate epimerase-like enolase superfamily enzyme